MSRYAAKTEVPASRSKSEIEELLTRFGATRFQTGWGVEGSLVAFEHTGRMVRFVIPHPDRDSIRNRGRRSMTDAQVEVVYRQEERSRWRAMHLIVKAKIEAVESGIAEFTVEFMPYTVTPNGQTVADWLEPQLEAAYAKGSPMKALPGS